MKPNLPQVLEENGGDDGTRTRGLCRDSERFTSICNDLQEHGRHPKSLQDNLDIAVVYLAVYPLEGNRSYGPPRSFPGKVLRSNLRYFVSDARISARGG
jgi:hypothetical protein